MKKKISPIPKNKKCACGKEITHHHFECDDCHKLRKKTNKLKRKAMKKIEGEIGGIGKSVDKNPAWKKRIHYEINKEGKIFYLCNQACNTFPEKRTTDKNKVTCINCLRKIK